MTTPTARQVVARRRRERRAGLQEARAFAADLDPELDIAAVVVVGSFARGDFHSDSDVDVLVVATNLPEGYLRRLEALDWPRPGCTSRVEPVVWTPHEFRSLRAKSDPIAVEATTTGVVVQGELPSD